VVFRSLGVSSRAYGVTVRNRGPQGRRMGRPFLLSGLRARVSSWPPLRVVRLRCERVSVGVVPSQRFPFVDQGEGSRGSGALYRDGCISVDKPKWWSTCAETAESVSPRRPGWRRCTAEPSENAARTCSWAYPCAFSFTIHDLISEGRMLSSRRGPNSATILAVCTSAMRTVERFRLAYAFSHVSHHWATVVLAVFGAT
jgi:hypothetical protein